MTTRSKKTKAVSSGIAKPREPKNNKPANGRLRQARILLRHVDSALKTEGVEAAVKALMQVRLEIPLNPVIRRWLRDYQDMLEAWLGDLMPEVVDEFNAYGCRRARDLAHRRLPAITQERLIPYYLICERVFEQMGERRRLSVSDVEEYLPDEPQVFSLDEVSEDELQRGTKY